jgi:Tol biopolymer transport system component
VHRVALPGGGRRSYVTQSPDGRLIAFVASPAGLGADANQMSVVDVATGVTNAVTDGWTKVASPAWSHDGRVLFYVSNAGGSMDLWQQRIGSKGAPTGRPAAVTAGVMMRNAVFTRDGSKLAYSQGRRLANVWRVPILRDRSATWADAQQITADDAHIESLDVSPDGAWLALDSDRSGARHLWIVPSIGGDMRRLTTSSSFECDPRWSHDGKRIAFYGYRSGNRDLWVVPAAGGAWAQVTSNPGPDLLPTWSPDDRTIAHLAVIDGVSGVWATPANGGPSRLLAPAPDAFVDWGPDGKIVFSSGGHLLMTSGGSAAPVRDLHLGPVGRVRWSPDGKWIYAVGAASHEGNLFVVAADGAGGRAVTDLRGRRGMPGPNALATDGRYLYFAWDEDLGDLWVMDVVRPHD